jgi:hypothetical protein
VAFGQRTHSRAEVGLNVFIGNKSVYSQKEQAA